MTFITTDRDFRLCLFPLSVPTYRAPPVVIGDLCNKKFPKRHSKCLTKHSLDVSCCAVPCRAIHPSKPAGVYTKVLYKEGSVTW